MAKLALAQHQGPPSIEILSRNSCKHPWFRHQAIDPKRTMIAPPLEKIKYVSRSLLVPREEAGLCSATHLAATMSFDTFSCNHVFRHAVALSQTSQVSDSAFSLSAGCNAQLRCQPGKPRVGQSYSAKRLGGWASATLSSLMSGCTLGIWTAVKNAMVGITRSKVAIFAGWIPISMHFHWLNKSLLIGADVPAAKPPTDARRGTVYNTKHTFDSVESQGSTPGQWFITWNPTQSTRVIPSSYLIWLDHETSSDNLTRAWLF